MKKMKMGSNSLQTIIFLLILVASFWLSIEAATNRHGGNIKGKKPHPGHCNHGKCSPHVSHGTKAILTLNSFEKGGDGGGPSECDNKFHSDNTLIVALSTSWFNHRNRCLKNISIFGNGRRVNARVVDECDSRRGCPNNIVDASKAVWKALGVPQKDWGQLEIFWSDA